MSEVEENLEKAKECLANVGDRLSYESDALKGIGYALLAIAQLLSDNH